MISNSDNTVTDDKENIYAPLYANISPITAICLFMITFFQ